MKWNCTNAIKSISANLTLKPLHYSTIHVNIVV